jgi:competence protein ComEC
MRRPLVAVVVAYGIGLLLAQLFQPPLAALLVALGLLLPPVLAFELPRAFKPRAFLIWPLLAVLGWTNFTWRAAVHSPRDVRVLLGDEPALVTVRGVLAETPEVKTVPRDRPEQWHSLARVRVRELRRDGDFQTATGEVLATAPELLGPDFFAGQPVEFSGVATRPPPPLAEGLFDYRSYLAMRGIYYQVKTDGTNDWQLRAPRLARPPLTDRFLNWSHQTLALGLPVEDEPLRLLWAMTLGWHTAFTGDIADPFLQAGTMHMFAIDGLRIALVCGLIVTLLRLLRCSRAWCGAVAIPVIWFYTAATGWEASAMRASVMMTLVLGGWALKRPVDLLNSLAAAAFIILLAEPRQGCEAGFQLSFCVMLVIALLLPPINAGFDRIIEWWLQPDPFLPGALVPRWRQVLLPRARALAHFAGLSLAAWLGSLPLAAKYFHLFSPVSTFANLLAVPLGAGALTANLGALLCGHWLPWLTVLFNHAAWFLMVAMTWVSVQAARLPGAYWYVPEPSLPALAVYYAAVAAAFSGWFRSAHRKITGATAALLLAAAYGWHWEAARGETALTVLPLSGGHAVYVTAPGRRNDWLINCGNEPAVDFTLKSYLHGQGVNSLPHLVLADASARNCGGAPRLDALFGLGEWWSSGAKFRSPAWRQVLAYEHYSGPHRLWRVGDTNGGWQMLFPADTNRLFKAGDSALVLRGDFPGARVLLLSELSRTGQSDLLALTNDLRADIVIAGLPEEGEPLCDALLAAIRPRVVVIADSEFPPGRRAGPALRERLARAQVPVLYTRTAGAVKIVAGRTGWRLQSQDGRQLDSQSPH